MTIKPRSKRRPFPKWAQLAIMCTFWLSSISWSPVPIRSNPQEAATLLTQAAELQKARDFAGAETLYRQALADAPGDPEILKALGVVCQAEGKYDESINIFQSILKRAPLYPGVNGLLG